MNRNLILFLLISAFSLASWSQPALSDADAPRLRGMWRSENPERVMSGVYATREFEFTLSRWQETIFFSPDADMKRIVLIYRAEGPFEMKSTGDEKAPWNLDLKLSRRVLNLQRADPKLLKALEMKSCGLISKKEVPIESGGCGVFPTLQNCPVEYEIVQQKESRLFLSSHKATEFKCQAEARGAELDRSGLKRVN